MATRVSRLPVIFWCTHSDQDISPRSPSDFNPAGTPSSILRQVSGNITYAHKVVLDTGVDGANELQLDLDDAENTFVTDADTPWYSHSLVLRKDSSK